MKTVYLDNAATTPVLPEVAKVMQEALLTNYGNPSSTHQFGRKAKAIVETARKNIAKHFNASSNEIVFTSSGTEGDNLILTNAVQNLEVTRIITSKIEHHAVLHTVQFLELHYNITVSYVAIDDHGAVDLQDLERLLQETTEKTLVSLMFVNNEIGNILPLKEVCLLCKTYNALFHSDTVQAIGNTRIDLKETPIDFITASAHKFHGPKGVGFVYLKNGILVKPMLHGGNQEKGVRSSTENVPSILGMDKALTTALTNLDEDTAHKKYIKAYMVKALQQMNAAICFNGFSANTEMSSAKILSVRFPIKNKMFLFNLDLLGIAVSGGSACQSGSHKGSHVLQSFLPQEEQEKTSVRFSFSKFTTKADIDLTIAKVKELLLK